MLVSGATAKPKCRLQRRRARISARKRRTLTTTAGGGLPASTRSKCRRASLSSPLRKKARASSRRTRARRGIGDQHRAEGGDGLVEPRLALGLGNPGFLRRLDRLHAQRGTARRLPRPPSTGRRGGGMRRRLLRAWRIHEKKRPPAGEPRNSEAGGRPFHGRSRGFVAGEAPCPSRETRADFKQRGYHPARNGSPRGISGPGWDTKTYAYCLCAP